MAYRLRVKWDLDWVGAGMGPMSGRDSPLESGGGAQSIAGMSQPGGYFAIGSGTNGALNATDISTMTTALTTDLTTQLTAQIARATGWLTGGV